MAQLLTTERNVIDRSATFEAVERQTISEM
jgi:hypothetical protein